MRKRTRSDIGWREILVVVLLIVFFVFIILALLWRNKQSEIREEKIRTKASLEKRRGELIKILEEQKAKIAELDARVKDWYLKFRLGLVAVWIGSLGCIGYFTSWLSSVGDFVDLHALMLFFILAVNFLIYGKITDTREIIGQIQEVLRNWIYRKHLGIKEELVKYNAEFDTVELQIAAIDRELAEMDSST